MFFPQVMYAKAVWLENDRETEGAVPLNWVDREKGILMWPKKNPTRAFKLKENPKDDWMSFKLIKIKVTSGMLFLHLLSFEV